jgi:hypothetical protein
MASKKQHLAPAIRPLPPVASTLAGLEMFADVASVHRFFPTGHDRELYLADLARRRQLPGNTARPQRRAIRRPPVLNFPSSPDSDGPSSPLAPYLPLSTSSCRVGTEVDAPPSAVALVPPVTCPALLLDSRCPAVAIADPLLLSRLEPSPATCID